MERKLRRLQDGDFILSWGKNSFLGTPGVGPLDNNSILLKHLNAYATTTGKPYGEVRIAFDAGEILTWNVPEKFEKDQQ